MQIKLQQFEKLLDDTLAPLYCIAGDSILQRNEALTTLRKAAKAQGFDESEKHFHDKQFNWDEWVGDSQAMSLFSSRRIVELHLLSSAIGTEGSNAVSSYIDNLDSETLLIIIGASIKGKPKWVNRIIEHGVYLPIYPLEGKQLHRWLEQRAQKKNLRLSEKNAALLATRVEGNSIAAEQELEKLSLLLDAGSEISEENIEEWVADNARYSVFHLFDSALSGNIKASSRALLHLREEGAVIPQLTGFLANRLITLSNLKEFQRRNRLSQGFKEERVFYNQQSLFNQALQRLEKPAIDECVKLCNKADLFSKRSEIELAWSMLEVMLFKIAGYQPTHHQALLAN